MSKLGYQQRVECYVLNSQKWVKINFGLNVVCGLK